ncbi:hypothetical protein Tco_1240448, partial [Tanacetum coccineum]
GITTTIDRKVKVFVSEASIRRHLKLEDSDGISSLPTVEIFEQLALMGYAITSDSLTFQKGHFSPQWKFFIHTILHCLSPKKTAWEQFSSNIATAIICLATNRTFNFSNLIFEAMVKNLDSKSKFLMYPRFIQIFLNKRKRMLFPHKRTFPTPTLTQKLFSNMKRASKGYSGVDIPLFPTMLTTPESSPSRITSSPSLSPQTHPSTSQPPSNQTTPVTEEAAPMPHESPLQSVHSLGRDEGSLSLNELTDLCTSLSKKSRQSRKSKQGGEPKLSSLMLRKIRRILPDKEDPSRQGRSLIKELDLDAGISLVPPHAADQGRIDDTQISDQPEEQLAKDKGKAIMQESEPSKKFKKSFQVQMSVDEELAKKQLDKREEVVAQAHDIDGSDPAVLRYHTLQNRPFYVAEVKKNICMYLKNQGGYKLSYFKGMSYEDIRPIFERVWDQNQAFVPKDSEIEKEVMKRSGFNLQQEFVKKDEASCFIQKQPARGSRKKSLARKRARGTLSEEKDEGLNIESLATKQDVLKLYRLVKERFQTASPEGYDLLLWGDLKTMIEPNEEDEIWRNQQD